MHVNHFECTCKFDKPFLQPTIGSNMIFMSCDYFEVVVPIGYLLCFLAAYYGPNAPYLGNIGSSHWQYTRSNYGVSNASITNIPCQIQIQM